MNGVKHYVKYSMNECINNLKKIVYLRNNDIYIYMKLDVRDVANVPDVLSVLNVRNILKLFAKTTKPNFGRRPAANLFCLD